jgi:signal transduction histidine kinase
LTPPSPTPDRQATGKPEGFPTRFRRRLTIAFVLVAAVASGVLALGCLAVTTASRMATFEQRSSQQAALALALAENQRPNSLATLINIARSQSGFDVLVVGKGQVAGSNPSLGLADVPAALRGRRAPAPGAQVETRIGGTRYLVMTGPAGGGQRLYLFFSEASIDQSIAELRNILVVGWLVVAGIAALVGNGIARRTLMPVRAAADAARRLAGGLLETRLPARVGDEFGTWAACFNEMAAALGRTIASLAHARDRERAFTSDVAHELRTPLSAIVGAAGLVQAQIDSLPAEARRPVELLVSGTERLQALVGDLLELSRMEAGGGTVAREPVPLVDVVADVLRLGGWHGAVAVDVPPLTVETDPRRLERILMNLLPNAIRYGRRNVAVRARPVGRELLIEVCDGGPGISPADLPRIFDRFYKADRSRSTGGSGLGLAIAQENARLLGTRIEVSSQPGAGTRFSLAVPLAAAAPGTDPESGGCEAAGGGGATPGDARAPSPAHAG